MHGIFNRGCVCSPLCWIALRSAWFVAVGCSPAQDLDFERTSSAEDRTARALTSAGAPSPQALGWVNYVPSRAGGYDYNQALALDGQGDYAEVGSGATAVVTDYLAVEAWIRTSVDRGYQVVVSRYDDPIFDVNDEQFALSVRDGKATFTVLLATPPYNQPLTVTGTSNVADGQWHHLLGRFSSSGALSRPFLDIYVDYWWEAHLYLDQHQGTALAPAPGVPTLVGAALFHGSPRYFFSGEIDEVLLWDDEATMAYPPEARQRGIPLRGPSGTYGLHAAGRFNGEPDTGLEATLFGDAAIVAKGAPVSEDSVLLFPNPPSATQSYNGFLEIAGGENLSPRGSFSVAAWVSAFAQSRGVPVDQFSAPRPQALVSKYQFNSESVADDSYFLGLGPEGWARFAVSNGIRSVELNGSTKLRDGGAPSYGWHFLAGVCDGRELRLYVDGNLEASAPFRGGLPKNATPLYLGASRNGSWGGLSNFFFGFLEDVKIWERALSAQELVRDLRRPSVPTPSDDGLLAHWRFEGDFLNYVDFRTHPTYGAIPRGAPSEFLEFAPGDGRERAREFTLRGP